jgi:tetratricopeptide (TPR) repeat protein
VKRRWLGRLARAGVPLIVVGLWSGSAWTQDPQDQTVQDKVVQLNRAALADVDDLEWDRAKKTLLDALVTAKKGGLDNHPIMARTYVHLGAVYVTGFKNRDKAIQSFRRALEIEPSIKLSGGLATAEVQEVFAAAVERPARVSRLAVPVDGVAEPDLPVNVNALECAFTDATRVDQAVPIRCAVAPGLPVAKVFLVYREPAGRRLTEVEMKKTPKGWFQGRIPERVIYGQSVQFYFEGRNAVGKWIVRNGDEQSPNVIIIVPR